MNSAAQDTLKISFNAENQANYHLDYSVLLKIQKDKLDSIISEQEDFAINPPSKLYVQIHVDTNNNVFKCFYYDEDKLLMNKKPSYIFNDVQGFSPANKNGRKINSVYILIYSCIKWG